MQLGDPHAAKTPRTYLRLLRIGSLTLAGTAGTEKLSQRSNGECLTLESSPPRANLALWGPDHCRNDIYCPFRLLYGHDHKLMILNSHPRAPVVIIALDFVRADGFDVARHELLSPRASTLLQSSFHTIGLNS